jgi:hypothetical protein
LNRRLGASLDRYFNAFEAGKMDEDLCRPRIEALTERLRAPRARNSELVAAIEDEELTGPSPEELDALRARIRGAIDHGPVTLRKAVLQELVAESESRAGGSFGRLSGPPARGS